jgi:hypothetical protein
MRTFTNTFGLLGAASLILAAATACSSSSAIPPAFAGASTASASAAAAGPTKKKKHKALLYVADYGDSEVLVFDQTKKQSSKAAYTITNGVSVPEGITTDKMGNLYVTNYGANSVTIYAPGGKAPTKTITTGLNGPTDVAVDAYGNIYVSNEPRYGSNTNWIDEYAAGTTSPEYTWYPPYYTNGAEILGLAIVTPSDDGNSQILAAMDVPDDSYGTHYGDVASCVPTISHCFDNHYDFGYTQGITMEESPTPSQSQEADFLVTDDNVPGFDNVANYAKFTPVVTKGLTGNPDEVTYIKLTPDRKELFASSSATVLEYAYPSMKPITGYDLPGSNAIATGIATYPAGTYL